MKLRNLALAMVLATPVSMQFGWAQEAKKADEKPAKQVADPVCGMMVDPSNSPKSEVKGKTYYFCSLEDKKEFDRSPVSYIKVDKKETTKQ